MSRARDLGKFADSAAAADAAIDPTGNVSFADATGILDDSGNEQMIFQKTASAVNHVEVTNKAAAVGSPLDITTAAPSISAAGSDTNVSLMLNPKGDGNLGYKGVPFFPADTLGGWELVSEGNTNLTGHRTAGAPLTTLWEEVGFTGGSKPDATGDIRCATYKCEFWVEAVSGWPTAAYDDAALCGSFLMSWMWNPATSAYIVQYEDGTANGRYIYGPSYTKMLEVYFRTNGGIYNQKVRLQIQHATSGVGADADSSADYYWRIWKQGELLV